METSVPQNIRDTYPWAFADPNPVDVVARMKEGAVRVLAATTSPPGYGTAPEQAED
jgi:hypothetical protein